MDEETVRVWLAERTYSDDEQNLVILEYATPEGDRYVRKERALTSFDDDRPVRAAIEIAPDRLAEVRDPDLQEQYADAVAGTRREHAPDDEL